MIEDLQKYYLGQKEPNKSRLLALRSIILAQNVEITETVKYGMPCFLYKGKRFCYVWVDKKTNEPYILMVEGNRLHHPELEQGDRAKMKIFRVNPNLDLPLDSILEVLQEALRLDRKET
jgi:uncharacterized protein YdhG (YjbR/CyaY superfamily)